ncbi:MAG: FtsX-like permease family protein [Oscillospiraceae bacterium]|nr:FtsX-like permease family protein [Oscillospiraceae bacterium]
MNAETRKMLLRSIRATLGRFLAILAIVALGVGFYAGLRSSQPDMLRSAEDYLHRLRMYDFRLMSSLGLPKEDADAFRTLPGVAAAEGACFADAYARAGEGVEEVWHFQTLTKEVAVPDLIAGRMPASAGECLVDSRAFREENIGKRLTLTGSNSDDTLEHFVYQEYEIVGLAGSPQYISLDRGSSELGSGRPAGFVLLPADAFTDEVYHELLLWCDLPGEIYSEEYTDALRHLRPAVETLLNRRGVLRSEALILENSEELDRAREELDDGWSEYRLGLQKSAQELAEGKQKLEAAQMQLDIGKTALDESEKLLQQQDAELGVKQTQLDEKNSELDAIMSEHRAALSALLSLEIEVQTEQAAINAARAAAQIKIPSVPSSVLQDLPDLSQFGIDPGGFSDALSGVNDALGAIQGALDEAGMDPAELDRREAELNQKKKQLENLQNEFTARAEEISALDSEVSAMQTEISMTASVLADSRQALQASREELAAGEAELQAGWAECDAGQEKADKELAEARQKLEDAEEEFAKGRAELEDKLQPQLYALDRTANPGYVTFENDSAIVDGIAVVFPVFFVLVASLVCITTMTRMVTEERTQIGTLKAMGYASPVIMAKYLLYASVSALLGCVLGFFIGCIGLPYIVWYAYNIMYQYAGLRFRFSGWMFAACLLVSVAGSLFVTWLACRSSLAEKPAELIRPKAPAVGRRVLLERIGPLWRRLPFLSKVSIRNAFRYPSRVFMMLLGIGGCTALLVAGFGTKDSLSGVGSFQYDEISLYDIVVTLDTEKAGAHPEALWADWSEHSALTHREEIRLLNASGSGKDTELILADGEAITPLLSLHTKNGTELSWPAPGEVVITKKLSDSLGLQAGDSAVLRLAGGRERSVTVAGVCEYYVGHAVFAAPEGYADTERNYALIRVREGEDAALRAARLRSAEGVSYVSLTQTERETLESSMASIDLLVLMLVFCSGALAFITLYNLTNINIMERIREVATVKVLGFTPRETAQYILNENLMLSFLGAALGLLLGIILHRFVMESINLDYMSYDVRIAPISYGISFVITFAFALLTNLFMQGKLEKVNMAESLKSVE